MHFSSNARRLVIFGLAVPSILLVMACGTSAPSDPSPQSESPDGSASAASEESQESVVAVQFSGGELSPETIQVKHGDNVTLGLETDRPGSFHIHGYDLEQEARVGEVTKFQFVANATGRFGINFHGQAGVPDGASDDDSGGEDHHSSSEERETSDHGSMEHGPLESAVPVSLSVSATVAEGGVHVVADTEGWHWAPEGVNGANRDGAGHAHIYADGVKLSRMYGPYHYIQSLPPGSHEIKVSLNSNDHSELTWEGRLLEASDTVTIPENDATAHHSGGLATEGVVSEAPMSVEIKVNEDALGGYNVQVIPAGFEFSTSVGDPHVPGQGFAALQINGEEFNRLYVPWLQAPAQGEGMHTFEVVLLNNEGKPYHFDGRRVVASEQVHELGEKQVEAAGSTRGKDGGSAGHHGSGAGHDHGNAAASDSAGVVEELEVGYLEVLP